MDFELDPADVAFREEVREFFTTGIPQEWRTRVRAGLRLHPEELIAYQKRLAAKGWGAPTWPAQYGGTGWSPIRQYIFWTEAAEADAPAQFHQGLELIGPIIFTYGSAAQKARFLPGIVNADDWWCQGYSEPNAGSDLASLRTRAVRDGDHYVLNGQKAWTSYGHVASHCFVLARTSDEAKRQQGISLFLLDMKTPGITIRPVATMDEKHHTNEMFLDDVRVPVENLVGEEGRGWEYGKVLLDRERMVTASVAVFLIQTVKAIRDAASRHTIGGVSLLDKPDFKDKLAQYEIEVIALQTMVLRVMADASAGVDSGPLGSMIKLRWSQLLQAGTALWIAALGPKAAHFAALDHASVLPTDMPYAMQGVLHSRVTSIYGGSSEIQHNIIAQRALGLKG
ncbi:acyl-CoA dehydrogenase-like protein [Novosphingobium aromaticivorans DSM 12444]|uniref:Acyl-CoA dehydrogenase-like protein n=1 Tax=Novosphingobium aromaticivorans (strain ATCC 700278 / DSM 12444 / CCUG 56034 / CIP 105152 / NBRC 16084 / F199) TaxID=279238 RepID=Q2G815_NOVAD|nr:acyl-CoA dehydrogenase family protein [Novosphingobium aromaticivorans]ABD26008.1 acyl-CoA dehydrogenase-like protein [Novosphingobium aromaticivorans DSM 12444]SCY61646.1 Acyl-CoA dehydrogenase [Novosphingobium aromaticivorans]